MKKNKKQIVLVVIALIIASLAFGYAYLTTTLSINGITDIDRNSWDVYFDNVQVTDGSVSGAQVIEAPTITSDTEVEFHVNLKKPGDFYEFTIDAKNDGTIDAMINSVSKKLNNVEVTTLPAYLNYTVTYEDDIEIQDKHLLAAESLETYKVRVEFKKDINSSDLPSTAQSLTLSFGVEYIQADENAIRIRRVYTTSTSYVVIGQKISNNIVTYNTLEEATSIYGYNIFLKHILYNDIVVATYIGKIKDGSVLLLRSGDVSFDNNTNTYINPYFEKNINNMNNVFGKDKCNQNISNNIISYYCKGRDLRGDDAGVFISGRIYTTDNGQECSYDAEFGAKCDVEES